MAKVAGKQQLIKKAWYVVLAPKLFNEMQIGETFVADPQLSIGKIITVSLTTLTNDIQRQHINIIFKVTGVAKGNILQTEMIGYRFSPGATRRFVRRARSKLDDSFTAITADGKKLRLKPLLVTRARSTGGTEAAIRKAARDFFTVFLSRNKLEQFWAELLQHNVQRALGEKLKKLSPLSAVELRWVLIEGEGIPPEMPAEEVKEIKAAVPTEEVLEEAIDDAEVIGQ
jgi:small subunit ribosomal protein S3Ae